MVGVRNCGTFVRVEKVGPHGPVPLRRTSVATEDDYLSPLR